MRQTGGVLERAGGDVGGVEGRAEPGRGGHSSYTRPQPVPGWRLLRLLPGVRGRLSCSPELVLYLGEASGPPSPVTSKDCAVSAVNIHTINVFCTFYWNNWLEVELLVFTIACDSEFHRHIVHTVQTKHKTERHVGTKER